MRYCSGMVAICDRPPPRFTAKPQRCRKTVATPQSAAQLFAERGTRQRTRSSPPSSRRFIQPRPPSFRPVRSAHSLAIVLSICTRSACPVGMSRATASGDKHLVPLRNSVQRGGRVSFRVEGVNVDHVALPDPAGSRNQFSIRFVLRFRPIDHVFHEARNSRGPVIIVVLPDETFGVQHQKHLGRVPCMPSQQCIQHDVGHRTVRFAERQRHIPRQRQGVHLTELVIALPIILGFTYITPPETGCRRIQPANALHIVCSGVKCTSPIIFPLGDVRRLNRRGDMLRAGRDSSTPSLPWRGNHTGAGFQEKTILRGAGSHCTSHRTRQAWVRRCRNFDTKKCTRRTDAAV